MSELAKLALQGKFGALRNLICQQSLENVNTKDHRDRTPLYCACLSGSIETVEVLLQFKADASILSFQNKTCLHAACEGGNIEIIKLFLKNGIFKDEPDLNGIWPLDVAVASGHSDIVEYLRNIKCLEQAVITKVRALCLANDLIGLESLNDEGYDLVQAVTSRSCDNRESVIFSEVCAAGFLDICQYLHQVGVGLDEVDPFGFTPLHYGCLHGHRDLVEWLLCEGVDVSQQTECKSGRYVGLTSVHLCGQMGFVEIMKLLLDSGGAIDSRGQVGSTPVFESVVNGRLEMVNYLCERGCDVRAVTDTNQTIVHGAAMSGNLKMMKRVNSLLSSPDVEDSFGLTPFLLSCEVGKVSVMQYLVDEGCNIFHRGGREDRLNSALHITVSCGHVDATCWLLDRGLNPESRNEKGQTPLDIAGANNLEKLSEILSCNMSKYSCTDRVRLFLDPMLENAMTNENNVKGVCILKEIISMMDDPTSYVNEEGNTLLHFAAAFGDQTCIALLHPNESSLLLTNSSGFTPAHVAALKAQFEIVQHFSLLQPILYTLPDHAGNTVLHTACDLGHLPFVTYLIEKSPECVLLKNNRGWTALHYACSRGFENIVKLLIEAGAKATVAEGGITPLHLACYNNHSNIAIYLICQSDVNVSHIDDSGMCALDIANLQNLTLVLQTLYYGPPTASLPLNQGSSPNYSTLVVQDMFFSAVQVLDIPLMKRMLQLGADINYFRAIDGLTALNIACPLGNLNIIDFLLTNGANINLLNRNGLTSLHILCQNYQEEEEEDWHPKVIKHLLQHGASLNTFSVTGVTPFHLIIANHALCSLLLVDEVITASQISPDLKNHFHQSPLHIAILEDSIDAMTFLLKQRVNMNVQDSDGFTPLCLACRSGNYPMSLKLINAGADVNICDNEGGSPLYRACSSGNLKLVQALIDNHANIDVCTQSGDSILHIACQNGRFVIAKYLISLGMKLDSVNKEGLTARSYGLSFGGNKSFQEWIVTM